MTNLWDSVTESSDLEEADAALATLEELLGEEQGALRAFDAARLRELGPFKNTQIARLRGVLDRASSTSTHAHRGISSDERRRLVERSRRVAVLAAANHALLTDAIHAVGEALGLVRNTGTYDQRARLGQAVSSVGGKEV